MCVYEVDVINIICVCTSLYNLETILRICIYIYMYIYAQAGRARERGSALRLYTCYRISVIMAYQGHIMYYSLIDVIERGREIREIGKYR